MRAMKHNGGGRRACFALGALFCGAALAAAPPVKDDNRWPERMVAFNVTLGAQTWPAAAELNTQPLGTFDEVGLNLAAAVHIPWQTGKHGELLAGLELGLMSHESNIRAPGDIGDVSANVIYLAPSLRWSFREMRFMRVNLDAGAGAYVAEIKEFVQTSFGVAEGTEHFEEWAPGGFVGISFDIPVGRTGRWSINTGARMHLVDFGGVVAFGADLGRLNGPITTLQLGVSYDWNGKKLD